MFLKLFSPAQKDRPLIAIALLLLATFTLALQDTLMKLMATETSFWQIQTLRSVDNIVISILLAAAAGGISLIKPHNHKGVLLRSVFLAITMFLFFSDAPLLTVSEMAAGLYTYPIFVCLLAGPVLGKSIGPWRTGSILISLLGALLVISPWQEGFNIVQLLRKRPNETANSSLVVHLINKVICR